MREAAIDIVSGLKPETWTGAAWSTEQCLTALRAIVSSPHAAVPVSQLEEQVGAGSIEALKSMNEQNLLLRRSFHEDARDIDPVAFGPQREGVYTLPSAAQVVAARAVLDDLDKLRKP